MFGYQCIRCGEFWSCQASPEQDFAAITKFCPKCIPLVCPQVTFAPNGATRGIV